VTFAPASQLEQVKVISPVQSPDTSTADWASTGANSYEEEDETYDGLADSDTLDEVSPTGAERVAALQLARASPWESRPCHLSNA
jgi:hypothetical protein